ncbi:LPS export ABC transporter periplasmic protein LptC [Gloeobacter kilaueensis]|uniref:LPS export ABC transporter periplasmic protein LptC n=1 Tax=Gloeobacter kilaueensis (strain ATCC BAA-2537 / CCAP 1431/1 / ULC 316 / JS1) TaxID=1183438 RepID=U5QRS4_GLOK1|nr:LPS export ABC transporter periplasmic protein LptC [Gloeobacter kilaueensis]AGY60390.1 hypothetical protein GKIL_4144 [Gloeobacter kilaueensis JS1]
MKTGSWLLVGGGCLLLGACGGAPNPEANNSLQSESPLVLRNIVLTETNRDGNAPLWELKAERAEYSRDRSTAIVQQIQGVFYQNGRKVLNIQAPRGEVRIAAREILLEGRVKAVSPVRATTLDADRVQWFPDRNLLTAIGPVELFQPKNKVRARGQTLTGDLAAQVYTLSGNIRADSEVQKIEMNAPKVVWSLMPNRVTGSGGVLAHDLGRQANLKAPTISWEVDQNRVIARSDSTGRVYAEQPANAAQLQADRVIWDIDRRLFIAETGVDLVLGRPARRLQASAATYSLGQNTLQATNGRYWQPVQDLSITSSDLFADLAHDTVRATGQVNTRLTPPRP